VKKIVDINPAVTKAIYDKHLEIHYNNKSIVTHNGIIDIRLKGKISCPILNKKITPIVCAKMMDSIGWPRNIDPSLCETQAECFIYKSILKNMGYNNDSKKEI
jgi:hypothetical protein